MAKIKLTPENLGKLKRAYPNASIAPNGDNEYIISGIDDAFIANFGQVVPTENNKITLANLPTEVVAETPDIEVEDAAMAFFKMINAAIAPVAKSMSVLQKKIENLSAQADNLQQQIKTVEMATNTATGANELLATQLKILQENYGNLASNVQGINESINQMDAKAQEKVNIVIEATNETTNKLLQDSKINLDEHKKLITYLVKLRDGFATLPALDTFK